MALNLGKYGYKDKRGDRGHVLAGVNRTALAKALGMSRTEVSGILNGRVTPPWKTVRRFAEVLGVSLDEIDVWLRGLKSRRMKKEK